MTKKKSQKPARYQDPELEEIYRAFSEHQHQLELFAWANAVGNAGHHQATLWARSHPMHTKRSLDLLRGHMHQANPVFRWMHSIPNGGNRGGTAQQRASEGARMNAEGLKKGVADIFLPVPSRGRCGAYIELKRWQGGKTSKDQALFGQHVQQNGYFFAICEGFWEAIDLLTWYTKA